MLQTPSPVTDGPRLAFMRQRRARLSREALYAPHPSLVHAVALAQARLADMRLPDGPRLLIDPLGAGNPDIFRGLSIAANPPSPGGSQAIGRTSNGPGFVIADVLPRPDSIEPAPSTPAAEGVLTRLVAALRPSVRRGLPHSPAPPALFPSVAGRFAQLGDGSQAVVVDFGGLLAGWAPADWFKEMARILCPEGLYLCVSPGPTSLSALWAAWGRPLPVSPLWYDLHDLGDALAAAGLAAPVAESERFVLTYSRRQAAVADLRTFPLRPGPGVGVSAGILGSRACHRLLDALEGLRAPDGRIALHLECVLTHAWKPATRPLPKPAADPGQAVPVQWHLSRPG